MNTEVGLLNIFLFFFISVFVAFLSFFLSRKLKFEGRGSLFGPASTYFFIQISIFIIPGVFLISIGLFDGYWFVRNSGELEYVHGFYLSMWTIITVTFSMVFFSNIIKEKYLHIKIISKLNEPLVSKSLFILMIFLLVFLTLSYSDWPMVNGIIYGDSRLRRSLISSSPIAGLSYVLSLSKFVAFISASFTGKFLAQKNISRPFVFSLLFLSVAVASWNGAKAPGVECLFLFCLTYLYFTSKKLTPFLIIKFSALVLVFAYGTYWLTMRSSYGVDVQTFFLIRIFAGQMAGLYESLALGISNLEYIIHGLPFGSHFTDLNPFYKDLMFASEGHSVTTGVKNSLFVSEAYGIGGWPLAIISGPMFGFFIIVNARLVQFFLGPFFRSSSIIPFIFTLFLYMTLTSEFSSVVLFGRFFIFMFYSFVLIAIFYFLMLFSRFLKFSTFSQ